jgi:O-antigen/teichoic acid export membrane protein
LKNWALRATRATGIAIIAEIFARSANTIFFILLTWSLGEEEASIYALGFVYSSFLIYLSLGGLEQLLSREVGRNKAQGNVFLGNFLFARIISSIFCYTGLALWIVKFSGYEPDVSRAVLIIGATLIPESLTSLFQSYLIAHDRVGYIAILGAITGGLKLGVGALLLTLGGDAAVAAWVVLSVSTLATFLYTALIGLRFGWPKLFFERTFWITQARAEWPLFLVAIMMTIEGSLDTLLLAQSGNIMAVGVYAAAANMMNVLLLMPQAYRQILLPIMAEWYGVMREHAFHIYMQSQRFLCIIALPIGLSVALIADQLLPLLYKNQHLEAISVLQVLVWSFVFAMLLLPNGRLMLIAGHQNATAPIQLYSTTLNAGLNLLCQPFLGAVGAALARVASTGLTFVLCLRYVQRHIYSWNIWSVFRGPLGASLALFVVTVALRWLGVFWVLALFSGWITYGVFLFILGGISSTELRGGVTLMRRGTAQLHLLVKEIL